jgi:hypothetical protein
VSRFAAKGGTLEGVLGAQFQYAPLMALLAVCALMLVLRLTWSPRRHRMHDYGLLVPVATMTDPAAAARARDRLVEAGMRATLGEAQAIVYVSAQGREMRQPPGQHVLVFPADADRARALLAG